MTPEDAISSMILLYVGIPLLLSVGFQNRVAFLMLGLILASSGLTAVLKHLTRFSSLPFLKRPADAKGCNLQLTGRQGGQPGFPSGHLATTTAFWTCLYVLFPQQSQLLATTGVLFSGLMVWSRMKKSCHTFVQCIAGGVVGIAFGWIGMRVLKELRNNRPA